ncbi:MAG: phosphoribosylaminoimidazolesuccinocarboxamide synthase [Candidatus Methanoperedens sp.]|nr:phosphoribosylaminoimidazolesuccinocarboxamide synthase [Candidatus Methanoperedens sp.]
MKLIGTGKSKDIYLADNGDIIFEFTDRVTAFDGAKKAEFLHKGMVCCGLAEYWFKLIEKEGLPTHYEERIGETRMRVANLKILPVEVIWRNYVAGSLWRRFEKGEIRLPEGTDAREGALIPNGMLEFTTKFEVVDRPVSIKEILDAKWMTEKELKHLSEMTNKINDIMFSQLLRKDILLADFKVEFGKTPEGKILLADEVGTPDGCRFWDRHAYIRGEFLSLDKDVFRKNKGDLSQAYLEIYNRITSQG